MPVLRPEASPAGRAPAAAAVWGEAAVVGIALLALFVVTRSSNLALTHDGLFYLADIESGRADRILNPHHLLYTPLAAGWLGAARALGANGGAMDIVALLSGLGGAAAGALGYALLRLRAGLPGSLALAGIAGAAVSHGFWAYSTSVEVYLVALPLLVGVLLLLSGGPLANGRLVAAGALHGVAVLGHQAHVLFGVAALAVLWQRAGRRAFGRAAATFTAVGASTALTGYAAAVLIVRPPSVAWWVTRYAHEGSYWHGPSPGTLARAAAGAARAVVGGHFALVPPDMRTAAEAALGAAALADEVFLVRALDPVLAAALVGAALAVALGLAVCLALGLQRRRALPTDARVVAVALAVWIGIYAAFFVFWDPHNLEFWIPQATALWLLAATLLAPAAGEAVRRPAALLGATAAVLFVVNLLGSILPSMNPEGDLCRTRVGPLAGTVGPADLVVVDRIHGVEHCVRYLTGATGTSLDVALTTDPEGPFDALRSQVERTRARGGRVWLLAGAVHPAEPARAIHGETVVALAGRIRRAYSAEWSERHVRGSRAYALEPRPAGP